MYADHTEADIRIWQWPNILALDAALIAVAWQTVVSDAFSQPIGVNGQVILGLSVWLTYMADRLFDVNKRLHIDLLSHRHQFAKRHASAIWRCWWGLLLINVLLACITLTAVDLKSGFIVLAGCLCYTGLNQWLSRRFFPKELCVALIFAAGVLAFSSAAQQWGLFLHLSTLFLLNCLLVAGNEKQIDAALRVKSLTCISLPVICATAALFITSAITALTIHSNLLIASSCSALCLIALYIMRQRHSTECYRVLCDAALLAGPTAYALVRLFQ